MPSTTTNFRHLARLAGWSFATVLALGVAVIVGQTEHGAQRLQQALASLGGPAATPEAPKPAVMAQIVQKTFDPELETRKLSYQLQALAADRERLAARVASLERNLDDVTGSVKSVVTARITPPQTIAPPAAAVGSASPPANDNAPQSPSSPPPVHAAEPAPSAIPAPSAPETTASIAVPLPPTRAARPADVEPASEPARESAKDPARPVKDSATDSARSSTSDTQVASLAPVAAMEFGIDLGGANSIGGLRALWTSTRTAHAPLLDSLQPSAILRPTGRNGAPELRLMAGPFADAGAAAAICKSFAQGRGTCRPFAFDGQKMPLR